MSIACLSTDFRITWRTTSHMTSSSRPSHQKYAATTAQPKTPDSRFATAPTHVTGALPGKKPVRDPSAEASRFSVSWSSRCATVAGAVTAVSSRAWSWPLIRWLAAVLSAAPIGSRTSDAAYSRAATTRATISRFPAADDMPPEIAPGIAPTT